MKKSILVFIIILAAFVRFWQINSNPPSLNWDEVSHGYNAYSILKTGKDEWGRRFPLIFRAYGDYKLPVYIYLTVLSEAVIGLNALATRLPSALAGVASVLFTFLLVRKLFKSKRVAFLASVFLAISPWSVFLSRAAFEANLASFLIIAGIYFFLLGLEKDWFLPLSVFLLGLSLFTYNSARIFTPLIFIALIFLYFPELKKRWKNKKGETILSLCLAGFFFTFLVISLASPEGQARFGWVTLVDEGAIGQINQARGSSSLPGVLPILIHNKVTYFITAFTKNYFSNLSPAYLFFRGGSHYQYNIPGEGLIYPIQILPMIFGIYWIIKNWRTKQAKLITFWWLLGIIPSAITRDSPHVLRTILVLPAPQLLVALGVNQLWLWGSKNVSRWLRFTLLGIYGLFLTFLFANFLKNYFGPYRQNYSWAWQYGYKEVANFIETHYSDYDKIFITKKYGEPHEFLLFYLKWDPEEYRQDSNLNRYFKSNWYWVDSFDKFVFVNDWEVKEKLVTCYVSRVTCLLVTSPGNYPEGWSKIETINFLDQQPAFEILKK
jgi:4-amino-4-deoxy-L-arabinose transferase-like glycosyltransferase